jgi:D-glycero-D-manno-heptose 1,7-bisphosphate phosphatase
MNKAIFLDRDGVINRERGEYTFLKDDFILTAGLIDALKILIEKGYLLIVITNQGGIAKDIYSFYDVENIHNYLKTTLEKEDIKLTEIYYCPHHPDLGKCLCRKPGSLMLEKAIARFNIDASKSYFIGDNDRDIEAGIGAGVQTIKIESNSSLSAITNQIV